MTEPTGSFDLKSSDHGVGRFSPHGEFTLRFDGEVMCYEATGPFNVEGIEALTVTRSEAVEKWRPQGLFGAIVCWHRSALMSPQAFQAFRDGYEGFVAQLDCKPVVAWVGTSEVEGMDIMLHKFEDVYHRTRTRFGYFSDFDDAHAWVIEQLHS